VGGAVGVAVAVTVAVAVAVATDAGAEVPALARVVVGPWKSTHDSSRTVLPAEVTVSELDVTE